MEKHTSPRTEWNKPPLRHSEMSHRTRYFFWWDREALDFCGDTQWMLHGPCAPHRDVWAVIIVLSIVALRSYCSFCVPLRSTVVLNITLQHHERGQDLLFGRIFFLSLTILCKRCVLSHHQHYFLFPRTRAAQKRENLNRNMNVWD